METCCKGIPDIIICQEHFPTQIKESDITDFSKHLLSEMAKSHFNGGKPVPATEDDFKSLSSEVRGIFVNHQQYKVVWKNGEVRLKAGKYY